MENTLKKMEERISNLETEVRALRMLFVEKKGISTRHQELINMAREMRRDPDAWREKHSTRRVKK
jgi:hypothetical protein